ncbi:hypothetical protein [Acidithiobacillus thiooxidans]|uniref:hypothetical protein n=1 Tax=Acidithiobacillus thiooxidans TaxID=930 RepID=UPI0004E17910|nr:hypothetical protein [Acidithiobacillus thiooxidans]
MAVSQALSPQLIDGTLNMDVADAAWTIAEEAGVAHAVDMPIMLPRTTESADIKTQFFLEVALKFILFTPNLMER